VVFLSAWGVERLAPYNRHSECNEWKKSRLSTLRDLVFGAIMPQRIDKKIGGAHASRQTVLLAFYGLPEFAGRFR
jgi:hypothetical protein